MVFSGHTSTLWKYVLRHKNALTIPLTYNIHLGALCLLRVHALYGRSRRVLGLLLLLGMGSVVTAMVGCFPLTLRLAYAFLNIFSIIYQMSLFLIRKAGGVILIVSTFGGCAQYTPHIVYVPVADPAWDDESSSMIRLITLAIGADVSHRVTNYYLVTSNKDPVVAIAWTGALAFDSVIFFFTLYKAFTIGKGVELLNVIVRDGALSLTIR